MYPQLFLKTFWQMELNPEVFVAMSFDKKYNSRFNDIIAPAICSVPIDGVKLKPRRVDLSKSGDSILTEIMDGIAHSQLILADVSSVGKDQVSGQPYRNGNVMYEVGLALACRQAVEVLLIRDDEDSFLFDVSTIPHITIDFNQKDLAKKVLKNKLEDRLREQNYTRDTRVQLSVRSLTNLEADLLIFLTELGLKYPVWHKDLLERSEEEWASRLLDKQLIRRLPYKQKDLPNYELTFFGRIVAELAIREFIKSDPQQHEDLKSRQREKDHE